MQSPRCYCHWLCFLPACWRHILFYWLIGLSEIIVRYLIYAWRRTTAELMEWELSHFHRKWTFQPRLYWVLDLRRRAAEADPNVQWCESTSQNLFTDVILLFQLTSPAPTVRLARSATLRRAGAFALKGVWTHVSQCVAAMGWRTTTNASWLWKPALIGWIWKWWPMENAVSIQDARVVRRSELDWDCLLNSNSIS